MFGFFFIAATFTVAQASASTGASVSHSPAQTPAAPTPEMRVLTHPILRSIEALMNENGDCTLPAAKDVHFYCTGAIAPVSKPVIASTGCFFTTDIVCPKMAATVSGDMVSYFLNSPRPNTVPSADAGIRFTNVEFNANATQH